jgi:hypothetical protein
MCKVDMSIIYDKQVALISGELLPGKQVDRAATWEGKFPTQLSGQPVLCRFLCLVRAGIHVHVRIR